MKHYICICLYFLLHWVQSFLKSLERLSLASLGFGSISIGSFRLAAWTFKAFLGLGPLWCPNASWICKGHLHNLLLFSAASETLQQLRASWWTFQLIPYLCMECQMSVAESTSWIHVKILLHPHSLLDHSLIGAAALSLKKKKKRDFNLE